MTRVVAFGVFDGLHPGHIAFLRQARALGDELVVVVTQDDVARAEKGRAPALTAAERCEVVGALRVVDRALLGDPPGARGAVLRELRPDVIAVGYDQVYDADALREHLASLDLPATSVVRCAPHQDGGHHSSTLFRSSHSRRPRGE